MRERRAHRSTHRVALGRVGLELVEVLVDARILDIVDVEVVQQFVDVLVDGQLRLSRS